MFGMTWYKALTQPPLTPPAWVFPPMWSFLYILIFLALIIYVIKPTFKNKSWGFTLFFTQLILNFLWSPVFFYFHNIGMALAIVIIMDILATITIVEFLKISKTAGLILIPYLIWIVFATYINAGFFVLN